MLQPWVLDGTSLWKCQEKVCLNATNYHVIHVYHMHSFLQKALLNRDQLHHPPSWDQMLASAPEASSWRWQVFGGKHDRITDGCVFQEGDTPNQWVLVYFDSYL